MIVGFEQLSDLIAVPERDQSLRQDDQLVADGGAAWCRQDHAAENFHTFSDDLDVGQELLQALQQTCWFANSGSGTASPAELTGLALQVLADLFSRPALFCGQLRDPEQVCGSA